VAGEGQRERERIPSRLYAAHVGLDPKTRTLWPEPTSRVGSPTD